MIDRQNGARPWLWAAAFVLAMFTAAILSILGVVTEPWRSILNLTALSLVIPMVISSRRKLEEQGCISPALRTYNNRALAMMALNMASFFIAVGVHHSVPPGSPVIWLLALVPVAPLLGMIWTMIRYLAEETDEYLRHRAIMAALFGLALVLTLGTLWGFLETFDLVPHVWSWWVFPAWAIGLGIGQASLKARGQ
jgi:hypothetical protein